MFAGPDKQATVFLIWPNYTETMISAIEIYMILQKLAAKRRAAARRPPWKSVEREEGQTDGQEKDAPAPGPLVLTIQGPCGN